MRNVGSGDFRRCRNSFHRGFSRSPRAAIADQGGVRFATDFVCGSKGFSMNRGGWIVLAAAAWFVDSSGVASAQDPQQPRKMNRPAAADRLLNNEVDDLLQKWHQRTRK